MKKIITIITIVIVLIGGWYFIVNTPESKITGSEISDEFVNFQYSPTIQKDTNLIQTGDTVRLTWGGCLAYKDDIALQLSYLSTGVHKTRSVLIADNIENRGVFDWEIPTNISTAEYKIYISSQNCGSGIFGKNNIHIQQTVEPFSVFITPKASETIQFGSQYKINWTSNSKNNVDIGYRSTMVGNSDNIYWIDKDIVNNDNYSWIIPIDIEKGWTELLLRDTKTNEQITSGAFIIGS